MSLKSPLVGILWREHGSKGRALLLPPSPCPMTLAIRASHSGLACSKLLVHPISHPHCDLKQSLQQ